MGISCGIADWASNGCGNANFESVKCTPDTVECECHQFNQSVQVSTCLCQCIYTGTATFLAGNFPPDEASCGVQSCVRKSLSHGIISITCETKGHDVVMQSQVTCWSAVEGADVSVATLSDAFEAVVHSQLSFTLAAIANIDTDADCAVPAGRDHHNSGTTIGDSAQSTSNGWGCAVVATGSINACGYTDCACGSWIVSEGMLETMADVASENQDDDDALHQASWVHSVDYMLDTARPVVVGTDGGTWVTSESGKNTCASVADGMEVASWHTEEGCTVVIAIQEFPVQGDEVACASPDHTYIGWWFVVGAAHIYNCACAWYLQQARDLTGIG